MSKVTATCIGKCLVTYDVLNKPDMEATVPLAYVDQLVPLPLNMFPYEKCIDSSQDIFNCISLVWANNVLSHDEACHINVTGNHVASYYDVARICLQLQMIKQQFSTVDMLYVKMPSSIVAMYLNNTRHNGSSCNR